MTPHNYPLHFHRRFERRWAARVPGDEERRSPAGNGHLHQLRSRCHRALHIDSLADRASRQSLAVRGLRARLGYIR